jgi:hypothetical protein
VKFFSYFDCGVTYDYDDDVNGNMQSIQNSSGTIAGTVSRNTEQKVLMFVKVIDLPIVVYSSKS